MSLFTTDREASRFHLVNRADMALIRSENFENRKTVGFVLTGWSKVKTQKGPNVFRFPYSCHSSYPELKRFLKNIKIEKLNLNSEQGQGLVLYLPIRQSIMFPNSWSSSGKTSLREQMLK